MAITERNALNPEFTPQIARGVRALRDGNRDVARRIFAHIVRADPGNATAWFWLSRSVDDSGQREDCLSRVRTLDEARRARSAAPSSLSAMPTLPENAGPPASGRPHRARRWAYVLTAVIVVLSIVAVPILAGQPAHARSDARVPNGTQVVASGLIGAEQILLASEYGGTIDAIFVGEGEMVSAGQRVLQLDTGLLDTEIEAARAAVDLAEAGLAMAMAGARAGQIAIAEAQLAQVQAARLAAVQAVSDTAKLVENPQDIWLQIAVLRAQSQAAEHRLAHALALKDAAEIAKDRFYEAQSTLNRYGGPGERRVRVKVAEGSFADIFARVPEEIRNRFPDGATDGVYAFGDTEVEVQGAMCTLYRWVTVDINLPFEAHLAPNTWWQAWVGVNAAAAEGEGIQASLDLLYSQVSQPQELQARLDQAVAVLAQAEAQVERAQAQVDGVRAGATREQVAVLRAQVEQARAALTALQIQRTQLALLAPIDGMVVALSAHRGEIAAPGAALATLADLRTVRLTVYLPQLHLGQVQVGDQAQVSVDSFPGRAFTGTVSHIADTAEFTPRNVATVEERVNLVYAVEIDLPNADGALKPGMPADALFN
jgi:multidrug efflux pump subunit AcrA (membrane-fusion protein)